MLENKEEKFAKNDFSVLDPVGYVSKQQEKMKLRRINDRSISTENGSNVLPILSPRYVSPAMNFPSANRFGMFAKTNGVYEPKEDKRQHLKLLKSNRIP